MIPTDDPLLSALRYRAYDAPDFGDGNVLHLQSAPYGSPSILDETEVYYGELRTDDGPKSAVEAITDGRLDAFLVANPRPSADWSIEAYKPPLHPLDGIRFNLAEQPT